MSRKRFVEPKQQHTFQMPLDEYNRAYAFAMSEGVTFSELIREAIRRYVPDPIHLPPADKGKIRLALDEGPVQVPTSLVVDEIIKADPQPGMSAMDILSKSEGKA